MNHKTLTSVVAAAVVTALLLGAACSGGDDDTAGTAGAAGGDKDGAAAVAGGGSDGNSEDGGRPQDSALDVEVRHPNGVVLRVSSIAFQGDDVVLDTEVVNSSRDAITLHPGNYASNRLRLLDDAGQEYNFVETQEDQPIDLAPGETLSGTMAFRGPLLGQPERLRLVTNVYSEDVDAWRLEDELDSSIYPGFVVPIELTWQ